ncbi:MAG TPA: hypothetical protein VE093_12860 [Polyangiaceae bacterium]|nr:hypothetical protein [Polyangiaceae bacterium]
MQSSCPREVTRAPNGMAALVLIFRYIFTVRERLDPEERLKGSSEELLLAFSDQHLRALMPPPRLPPASAAAAACAFDIAFALLGCQVFAPFFVVASALIKLEEGSPSSSGDGPKGLAPARFSLSRAALGVARHAAHRRLVRRQPDGKAAHEAVAPKAPRRREEEEEG